MTVHVLMPVFNRLAMTRTMLACLRSQVVDETLSIVVIDDGSTDGTGAFLATQPDVMVLRGDGSLWWGGAMDRALAHVLPVAAATDWVLFVNNDTTLDPDFVQALLDLARRHAPAAVGSAVRDVEVPHALLSVGPIINAWNFTISELPIPDAVKDEGLRAVSSVDALSGRGALFPVAALRAVGGMRPRWLPHYMADYELSLRVRSAGWRLVVCSEVAVWSRNEFGNAFRGKDLRERFFSVRSPSYLPALVRFWWAASSFWQRITLPVRLPVFALLPSLRK